MRGIWQVDRGMNVNDNDSEIRSMVEISSDNLARHVARRPERLAVAVVEPRLELVEEFVLLSLDAPRRAVRRAASFGALACQAGPKNRTQAVKSLIDRGLVARSRPLRRPAATRAARIRERLSAVRAIIQSVAPPRGRDADLLVLLALADSLPVERGDGRRHAILRISSIGTGDTAIPPVVAAVAASLNVPTMRELANRLLPPTPGSDGWVQIDTPSGVGM